MPRKKILRSAKGKKMQATTKKIAANTALTLAEKMEKDFRDAPAKLIAQCRKELTQVKQQENKLKKELNKATVLQKALKKKHAVLSAKKLTPAAKKQLSKTQKIHEQLVKGIKEFTAKLAEIKQVSKALTEKLSKFAMINKQLALVEKQIAAKLKAKAKTKKKTTRKVKQQRHIQPENNPQNEESIISESIQQVESEVTA